MIKKLTLVKNFCHYFPKTKQRVFEFSNGWNTFFGDNGTGKSTVLNCLDRSGWPAGSSESNLTSNPMLFYQLEVEGDTRVIRYGADYIYRQDVIAADFNHGILGVNDLARFTFDKHSRGQDSGWYFSHFCDLYMKDLHDTSSDIAVLIDEPENSLSLFNQMYFYKALRTWADQKHIQIICASHSPILMHKFSDKVFELSPNYIKRIDKDLSGLFRK